MYNLLSECELWCEWMEDVTTIKISVQQTKNNLYSNSL